MIAQLLGVAFGICLFIQGVYWLIIFGKLAFYPPISESHKKELPPLSIVICAFNEEQNLTQFLPQILEQDYPHFEVLVVNDDSSDNTKSVLEQLKTQYPHLNTLHLHYPKGKKLLGKKGALAQGIRAAQYDWILLTDADCYPNSKQWAREMARSTNSQKNIALGYAPYQAQNKWLNAFIRFETVYTAIQYFSASLWGSPYMGVGRNMMYNRQLFFKVGGFQKHEHIASGDDDLFIKEVATSANTAVVLSPKSFMYSAAKDTWKGYFRQKSRHVTTGTHYHWKHQVALGLLSASHFGLYFTLILLLLFSWYPFWVVSLFTALLLLKIFIFARICYKLNENYLIPFFPILDALYILYYVTLAPALFWGKTKQWK